MKIKRVPIQVKAGPDDNLEEGKFIAYASTFTREPDSYGDVVRPGAFAKTLEEWRNSGRVLPVLWGHDMADPFSNIGEVVDAVEDDRGLKVTGLLDLDNPKARQVYKLIKGRRVTQMSFAYDVVDCALITEDGVDKNELREIKLYEISIVPIGANQETEILEVKADNPARDEPAEGEEGDDTGETSGADNVDLDDLQAALELAQESITRVLEIVKTTHNSNEDASASGDGGKKADSGIKTTGLLSKQIAYKSRVRALETELESLI